MLKRTRTAAALAVAALAMTTTPAHADVHSCVLLGTATFTPRLTTTFQTGTITFDYDYRCVAADTDGGAGTGLLTGHNDYTIGYSGSCLTANLTGPYSGTGVLVGGTAGATVSLETSSGARVYTLASLDPCNVSQATLVSSITYGVL